MTRIVTRLDGARCKKPDWRLHVRPEAFREQMICEKKVLVTLLGLFGIPAVIRRSIMIRRPGNCAPLPLSLRLRKLHKYSTKKPEMPPVTSAARLCKIHAILCSKIAGVNGIEVHDVRT